MIPLIPPRRNCLSSPECDPEEGIKEEDPIGTNASVVEQHRLGCTGERVAYQCGLYHHQAVLYILAREFMPEYGGLVRARVEHLSAHYIRLAYR